MLVVTFFHKSLGFIFLTSNIPRHVGLRVRVSKAGHTTWSWYKCLSLLWYGVHLPGPKNKNTLFSPPCASLFSLDDITSFWQGRLYVIVSIVAYTVCHALSTGTVTHGLWRPDLQLPLLFVSSCLAYFHKDKHSHLFCFAFPWKWKKKKNTQKLKRGGGCCCCWKDRGTRERP